MENIVKQPCRLGFNRDGMQFYEAQDAKAQEEKGEDIVESSVAICMQHFHDNGALYRYVQDLKRQYMRSAPPLGKVRYCEKISTVHHALGLHTYAVRVQGNKLKRKNELRVGSVFRQMPAAFLRAIVVHELAHLRHRDHDRAFYRLCTHMEPDYHRHEADLRLWLFAIREQTAHAKREARAKRRHARKAQRAAQKAGKRQRDKGPA